LGELRKDYFTDERVVIGPSVLTEPLGLRRKAKVAEKGVCELCPGGRGETFPAAYSLLKEKDKYLRGAEAEKGVGGEWRIRILEKKFFSPVPSELKRRPEQYLVSPFEGRHYIAVLREHKAFSEVSVREWKELLIALTDFTKELYRSKGTIYVGIFIDSEEGANEFLPHPVAHILSLPFVLPRVVEEIKGARSKAMLGECAFCTILSHEKNGPRHVFSTEKFTAFSPWAPRHPYEVWIFPIKHSTHFSRMSNEEIEDLAKVLRILVGAMGKMLGEAPFNAILHDSPKKEEDALHWHVELYPELVELTGLERGYEIYVNPVTPEEATSSLSKYVRRIYAELQGIF